MTFIDGIDSNWTCRNDPNDARFGKYPELWLISFNTHQFQYFPLHSPSLLSFVEYPCCLGKSRRYPCLPVDTLRNKSVWSRGAQLFASLYQEIDTLVNSPVIVTGSSGKTWCRPAKAYPKERGYNTDWDRKWHRLRLASSRNRYKDKNYFPVPCVLAFPVWNTSL